VDRRAFLAGTLGLLAVPLAAEAQTEKVYRIGMMFNTPGDAGDGFNPEPVREERRQQPPLRVAAR
jgi:hypothetical protein